MPSDAVKLKHNEVEKRRAQRIKDGMDGLVAAMKVRVDCSLHACLCLLLPLSPAPTTACRPGRFFKLLELIFERNPFSFMVAKQEGVGWGIEVRVLLVYPHPVS